MRVLLKSVTGFRLVALSHHLLPTNSKSPSSSSDSSAGSMHSGHSRPLSVYCSFPCSFTVISEHGSIWKCPSESPMHQTPSSLLLLNNSPTSSWQPVPPASQLLSLPVGLLAYEQSDRLPHASNNEAWVGEGSKVGILLRTQAISWLTVTEQWSMLFLVLLVNKGVKLILFY